MVAGGSGLAPMRALLQQREYDAKRALQQQDEEVHDSKRNDNTAATNVLFFGCKNKGVDYIYREELEAYQARGVLTALHTAFSRDGPSKVYVQGLMTECGTAETLASLLLNEGAYVYVCGATAMGSDVMTAFSKVLQRYKGWTEAEAAECLKSMVDSKRYVRELWTAS